MRFRDKLPVLHPVFCLLFEVGSIDQQSTPPTQLTQRHPGILWTDRARAALTGTTSVNSASLQGNAVRTAGSEQETGSATLQPLGLDSSRIDIALIIAFHISKRGYHELGENYLEQINKDQLQRYFVKRLQRLGLKVILERATALA